MTRYESEFMELWDLWPKKEKRALAYRAWVETSALWMDRPPHSELVQIVRNAAAHFEATTEYQYRPNLAKWLREERWSDEYPTAESAEDLLYKEQVKTFGYGSYPRRVQ